MNVINMVGVLLICFLLNSPCFSSDPSESPEGSPAHVSRKAHMPVTVDDSTQVTNILKHPSIEVSGKSLKVSLGGTLKEQLESGNPSVTAMFLRHFKATKGLALEDDDDIVGFNFFLSKGKVYVQPFLGKNAR
ncbi:MAG: hypothetical protein K2Q34_01145 [Alphaproteobacteria bacterium]|nr:hypothetical protein [Alphaproteobacteria bacterium]